MQPTGPSDTSAAARTQQLELIAALSPSERFARALALSAMARAFAWAGARRVAAGQGPEALRRRFLLQVYGADVAAWVERRLDVERAQ